MYTNISTQIRKLKKIQSSLNGTCKLSSIYNYISKQGNNIHEASD